MSKDVREQSSSDHHRMTYWGYSFERACSSGHEGPVNSNVEFGLVFTGRLGNHRLLYGAEVDGVDEGGAYVELKTNRELLDDRTRRSFEEFKLMRCWAQCFLAGIDEIIFGFRDDRGVVGRVERVSVREVPRRLRGLVQWDPQVMLKFAEQFIAWLWTSVKSLEDGPFRLQYNPVEGKILLERGGVDFLLH